MDTYNSCDIYTFNFLHTLNTSCIPSTKFSASTLDSPFFWSCFVEFQAASRWRDDKPCHMMPLHIKSLLIHRVNWFHLCQVQEQLKCFYCRKFQSCNILSGSNNIFFFLDMGFVCFKNRIADGLLSTVQYRGRKNP